MLYKVAIAAMVALASAVPTPINQKAMSAPQNMTSGDAPAVLAASEVVKGEMPEHFAEIEAAAKAKVDQAAEAMDIIKVHGARLAENAVKYQARAAKRAAAQELLAATRVTLKVQFKVKYPTRDEMVEAVYDEAKAALVGLAADAVTGAYEAAIPEDPTSSACTQLTDEVGEFEGHFETLVDDPMEIIDEKTAEVLELTAEMMELEDDLKTMHSTVIPALKTILTLCSALPYVGSVMSTAKTAITTFDNSIAGPAYDKVVSFNNAVTEPIDSGAQTLNDKNAEAAEKIQYAKDLFEAYFVNNMLLADKYCSEMTAATVCHSSVKNALATVNDGLATVEDTLSTLANFFEDIMDTVSALATLLASSAWNSLMSFFNGLSAILTPFQNVLNQQICITVPLPGTANARTCTSVSYPCGTKYCKKKVWRKKIKYPCGVVMCSKQVCVTVTYITYTNTQYCFTVQQILDGVMSAISLVQDALEDAISSVIPSAPSISIPGISIPTISIPSVPSFDFPSIGFLADFPNFPSIPFSYSLPEVDLMGLLPTFLNLPVTCGTVLDMTFP